MINGLNLIFFSWLVLFFQPVEKITMCGSMNQWANDKEFQAAHETPNFFLYENAKGERIFFKSKDGKDAQAYFVKAKKKSDKWLFVYQEWWGLNDYIVAQSDKFYESLNGEVNVLALDMYDGKIAANAQEAGALMNGADNERLENIVNAGVSFAGPKAKIANVGWCFGGSWSLKSAILGGKQTIGSVMYYGMPVQDVDKLKTLNTDVLGIFATEKWISKEVVEEFAANMKKANKKLNYKIFTGAHGFANPSNPNYNQKEGDEAFEMALKYLNQKYK